MAPVHGKASTAILNQQSKLYEKLPAEIEVARYHSWCVDEETVPVEIHVTAKLRSGEIMSIEHKNLPIHGLQFHPESILTPEGRTLISNWLKMVNHA